MAAAAGVTLGPLKEVTHRVIRGRLDAIGSSGRTRGKSKVGNADMLSDVDLSESLPGGVVRERRTTVTADVRFEIGPPRDGTTEN